MKTGKIKRLVALLIFAAALISLNPINAFSAAAPQLTLSVSESGNSVYFHGILEADPGRTYTVIVEYINLTGYPVSKSLWQQVYIPPKTSSAGFYLSVPFLPNGQYSARAYVQVSGNPGTERVTFRLPGHSNHHWYYPSYPYYQQYPYYPQYPYYQYPYTNYHGFGLSGAYSYSWTSGRPSVTTSDIYNVTNTDANVDLFVSSAGSSFVNARGVVFSSTNRNPMLGNSSAVYIGGATGAGTANLTNLNRNTTYYARAFATNAFGTSYGAVRQFTTTRDGLDSATGSFIQTGEVMSIWGSTATATGFINNNRGYTITERGFVYSDSVRMPSISDTRVSDSSRFPAAAEYSLELHNLVPGSVYNVRAYARTLNGSIFYGNIVSFKAGAPAENTVSSFLPPTAVAPPAQVQRPGDLSTIGVVYETPEGVAVGSEEIDAAAGQVLSMHNLSIPAGYSIVNPAWQYRVIADAVISVQVAEGKLEASFMPVYSGFLFKPDEFISRIELAQALYNLSNKDIGPNPGNYPDINDDFRKPAVDFVTSKNYMSGYDNGLFVPGGSVTRADIAVIVANFYNLTGPSSQHFADVDSGHWAYHYVSLMVEAGLMAGVSETQFKPDEQVTRAEATVILSIAENRSLTPITNVGFSDVFPDHWAYEYIMNAATPVQ